MQRKKAWKYFSTKELQIQQQVILNDIYWEWFLGFCSSTDNKATVSNLTQIEIGTTYSDLDLPWKIMSFRQQG